jgi:hypothetical protein
MTWQPSRVGDRESYELIRSQSIKVKTNVVGMPPSDREVDDTWHIIVDKFVPRIDAALDDAERDYTIRKFTHMTGTEDETQVLPPGATVIARRGPKRGIYTVNGDAPSPQLEKWLAITLPMRAADHAALRGTDLGTDVPRHIGETWPVNAQVMSQEFRRAGNTVSAADIIGTVTVVDKEMYNNIPCLRLSLDLNIPQGYIDRQLGAPPYLLSACAGSFARHSVWITAINSNNLQWMDTTNSIHFHRAGSFRGRQFSDDIVSDEEQIWRRVPPSQ